MSVPAASTETPTEKPPTMPRLLRERLAVQFHTAGLTYEEIAHELRDRATRSGYATTGTSKPSVANVIRKYRERVQEAAEDELRDSWEEQRTRLYGDLAEFRRRLVHAWADESTDLVTLDRLHERVLKIENAIARLEGNFQSAEVDLSVDIILRYAAQIGLDPEEVMRVADEVGRATDHQGLRVIQGGKAS